MNTQRKTREPERLFRDGRGTMWRVQEVDASGLRGARGPHCLIFASDSAVRRVWRFPADWRDLDDDELEALSWGR